MNRVRFGVVGLNGRGRLGWLRTLSIDRRAQVVAVCDAVAPRLAAGAALAGLSDADAHQILDDLLARADVDAVAVVVAPEQQVEIALKVLAAGKHAICEVPLAYTLEDCWRLVLAAERSGCTLALAEQCSYAPFVNAWRRLVQEGRAGKALYGEAQYLHGMTPDRYWEHSETGERLSWEEGPQHAQGRQTRFWRLDHPIWYTPHSLGPLLRVLDDRVRRVTCVSTRRPSYARPELPSPDLEVALMQTAGDTILRLAAGFTSPTPEPYHWYHLLGTEGELETGRRGTNGNEGQGLLWLAGHSMRSRAEVNWTFTPHDLLATQAANSGHGGLDYYPIEDFISSLLQHRAPTIDVYRAAEIAAPAILAGVSAEHDGAWQDVPEFRPGPQRRAGVAPTCDKAPAAATVLTPEVAIR